MIVVNLEKYAEENYYKQPANSPGASSPDNITHARLYYDTFAGSDYLQGTFVAGNNSSVEFDNSGISDTIFKLFTSTDGVTYTERKSYGGTSGADEFSSAMVLDPADYDDYDIPTKVTVSTVEQFLPKTLNEIVDGAGLSMNDYYFLRGKLYQDNSVYSGAPFFGSMSVNSETGALVGSSSSYYQNSASSVVTTISNYVRRSTSAKVSTGKYYLQCMVGATTGAAVNGFINTINGSANKYKFENSVFPVYGSRTVAIANSPLATISQIQRFSATHIRLKFTGYSLGSYTYYSDYIGTSFYIRDLVSDLLPVPNGAYELSSVDDTTGYLDFLCNTSSGNGSFTSATGKFYDFEEYVETYVPGLVGYVVLDVNDDVQTYYDTGKLLIKTYNTSDVLTDNILTYGCTLTLKALKINV
jgi:hypothetical protein